jgi:phenylacetic acid degradation operon negative regulatory protein
VARPARRYDGLGPLAEMRIRQILAEFSPQLAKSARHQTTELSG